MNVIVKTKKVKKNSLDEIFGDVFEVDGTNTRIVHNKLPNIIDLFERCYKLLTLFEKTIPEEFRVSIVQWNWEQDLQEWRSIGNNMEKYKALKSARDIKFLISIGNKLAPYIDFYNVEIGQEDALINEIKTIEWCPFHREQNIKDIFCKMTFVNENDKLRLLCAILAKLHGYCAQLTKIIESPDVDIDQFIATIVDSIEQLKRQPGLDRCGQAFDKISDSVVLLKENFGEYYKTFSATGDRTIIMQEFVIDVSKNSNCRAEVKAQFIKIINYYKRVSSSMQNSHMKDMCDKVLGATQNLDKNDKDFAD